jgi:DNA (cytosine-5)-methyltransferase 1
MSEFKDLAAPIRAQAEQQRAEQAKTDLAIISRMLEIYDQKALAEILNEVSPNEWTRETINKWLNKKGVLRALREEEVRLLETILPKKPEHYGKSDFTFIDLFAGIGGIRAAFERVGGECVFTSEWNVYAAKTYKANWYCDDEHIFNEDIRDVTLSNKEIYEDVTEEQALQNIQEQIPGEIDVLLAGFPCQPFSLAGVSKKNSLGRAHGFECETQGTLFFDVELIIKAKQPKAFLLENVKNLKSHDKGNTFRVIRETLEKLGYWVADIDEKGPGDPKVIDGKNFVPQHRERIVLVGFRKDLDIHDNFTLKDIKEYYPSNKPSFKSILDKEVDDKYTLTPRLWQYLYEYAKKHAAKGNGFGFGLVDPQNEAAVARCLSARYHKDGSEILIDHKGWDMSLAEGDFWNEKNQRNRPRRLTPRECARLMGFEKPGESSWRIPVSDTQAYRQFGNSVVQPVFEAVAKMMKPYIEAANEVSQERKNPIGSKTG